MSNTLEGQLVPLGGGDAIPLIREVLTVGRRETCDICMRFANISILLFVSYAVALGQGLCLRSHC